MRTGTGTSIAADTGSSTGGNLYSYGSASATDRALGSIGSGNALAGSFAYGVLLQNTSGSTLTITSVAYKGEEWRSSNAAAQVVDFSYQVASSAITTVDPGVAAGVSWIAATSANFTSPNNPGTAGILDGNATGNFANVNGSTSIAVPAGQFVMLRWRDPDHTGTDHALAIDDVTITWGVTTPPALSLALASGNILEGASTVATITRTGDLSASLTVDVASSDTTAATVPATATFAATSATATFNVTGFNDTIQDGSQTASITVSKSGYTSDNKDIIVDDDTSDVSLLTINEVCPDAAGDNNGDGVVSNVADEFIEFVNTSGGSLDISTWTVSDNNGVTFTFPAGTVLVTGQAAVLFGGGTVPTTIGSALAFKAPGGTNLNNTGGDLVAVKNGATLIAKMAYTATVSGQVPSFNLNGDLIPGPFVLHNAVAGATLDYSPGKKVDGTEFVTLTPLTLGLNPTSIVEAGGVTTSTGTVTRTGDTSAALNVNILSSNINKATVPATVEIPIGQTSAQFTVTAVDNQEPDGTVQVNISVSAIGFSPGQAVLDVVSDADTPPAPTLSPGAISFTYFNADGLDDLAFVALAPIPAGTVIHFTDNGWNGQAIGSGGAFNTGEGFLSWTAPAEGIPVGTIVVLYSLSSPEDRVANLGTLTGNLFLGATAETVYAYQGTQIYATGFLGVIATTTVDSVVNTGLSGSQIIYLPADIDVAEYTGARAGQATFAGYLPLLADTATNWITQDGTGDQSADATLPDTQSVNTTAFTTSGGGNTYGTWALANTGSAGASITGDHDFDGVKNGVEYFFGATGSSFTSMPVPVSGAVSYPRDATATSATYKVQTSPNLVTWTDIAPGDPNLDTSNPAIVKYTLPTGSGKLFTRLHVMVTP